MKKYNLSAEKTVKFLYKEEVNRVTEEEMTDYYPNPVLAKLFKDSFMRDNSYKITYEEIEEAEKRLGIRLPKVLREYYRECGDLDINSCFSRIFSLEELEFSQISDMLIFWCENQGVWNAGIKREDLVLDNPPVYMTTNDDLYLWEKITNDIDTFILSQVVDNLEESGFPLKILEDKKEIEAKGISIEELEKTPYIISNGKIKYSTYKDYPNSKLYIFALEGEKIRTGYLINLKLDKIKRDDSFFAHRYLIEIGQIISHNDREVTRELEKILGNFKEYLKNDPLLTYSNIENMELTEKIELKLLALALLLNEKGYLCYLDWKCELEDFNMIYDVMKKIGLDEKIEEEAFDEDDDITVWCEEFDKIYGDRDIFVGGIDLNSDSYSIFPVSYENLKKLKELGEKIQMKIDFVSEERRG